MTPGRRNASVSTCASGSNVLSLICRSAEFRGRQEKVSTRSLFSAQQCLCQRFSSGSNEVRDPKECVSGNKHQQIPSNPDSLAHIHTHTHTHMHAQPSLWISRDQTRGLGKRWPPFASLPCPCIQLREVMELVYTPHSTPTHLLWLKSQSSSINHFWEWGPKHRHIERNVPI